MADLEKCRTDLAELRHSAAPAPYGAPAGLGAAPQVEAKPEPAVSIRASVKNDHIVCLEDGKKMKMLERHLMTDHGLTPAEYRARWRLPADSRPLRGLQRTPHNF